MAGDILTLVGLGIVGFVTGALYFQGLWWTLRGLKPEGAWTSRFVASFIFRASLVVAVFYLLMGNDWRRIFALTLGFLVARFLMIRRIKRLPTAEIQEQTP